jgi:glycosyltransferase involved in cell wall biosynthesis
LDLEVLYGHRANSRQQADAGFGVEFDWDVPLLDGYRFRFLQNRSHEPSANTFAGIDVPDIGETLREGGYDAVLVNGWYYKGALQAIRACWKRDIPVMVRSDSHLGTYRHPLKRLLKVLPYRWFISRLSACLAVGQRSREYFLHYGASPDRVFIVPHIAPTVTEQRLSSLTSQRKELRQRWGFSDDHVVFIFAGKFIRKKRPMDFVRALQIAKSKEARVAGLMVGDGPLRRDCEASVGWAPIHFTGFLNQSQIGEAYAAGDALVLASDGGETWGLVVNEAMSYGRPCLVSDHVGCGADLVVEGKTGFTFAFGDVDSLAERMVRIASDRSIREAMGRNARLQVQKYSALAATDGVLAALKRIGVSE